MIPSDEVKTLAIEQGVPLPQVEKDYVMGWLLWGIYTDSFLSRRLILKGGNCLRKVYFADTRFSDDLDFTTNKLVSELEFKNYLNALCKKVQEVSGIVFDLDKTFVESKSIPAKDSSNIDGRVYFKGFAGDSSIIMRIKFDVSDYERIVLPLQQHSLIHPYSDKDKCKVKVLAYSLDEILAEKLRSWIQRTRPRDLFDVVKIVKSEAVPINKSQVITTFFKKSIFKNIPIAGRDEILFEEKFITVENSWLKTIICPASSILLAKSSIEFFKDFINSLFSISNIEDMKNYAKNPPYWYKISSGMREVIIQAGKARQLLRIKYDGIDRDVEPYSFRYKLTSSGGFEYFYGFDRTRGQTIKSFLLHKIQGATSLPQNFVPRWLVEF